MSSEDEAEGMEDILGVSRRLDKPSQTEPLPPELAVPEEEGMIRVPKKDLKRAQGILKDILALGQHRKMFLSKFLKCKQVTPVVSYVIRVLRVPIHCVTT